MARAAFAAAPLIAWTALALACAVDACPGSSSSTVRSCTSMIECTANASSVLRLAAGATLSASCLWIVSMVDDVYVVGFREPFNLTAAGGCSLFLQMGSYNNGGHSAGSSPCEFSRLKTGYLFFRSGSIVAIQPTPLLLEELSKKRWPPVRLSFRAGSALSLCWEAELEINQTTFVRTPFLSASMTPCVTTLKAGTGRSLNITVVDIWPNPAPSSCACYERLTAEPGKVTCWSRPSDIPVVDRLVNVSVYAAGEDCTVVLFAQVIELPVEFVAAAETQSVPSVPGVHQFPDRSLIVAISVTVGGGIVIIVCVAAALVVYHKQCISGRRTVHLPRRLLPVRPNERSPEAIQEPVYHELEDFTYRGHLIRREPVSGLKDGTLDTGPDVKDSLAIAAAASYRATANGSSATNDYEEIGPLVSGYSSGR